MHKQQDDPLGFMKFVVAVVIAALIVIAIVVGATLGVWWWNTREVELSGSNLEITQESPQRLEPTESPQVITVNNCGVSTQSKVIISKNIVMENSLILEDAYGLKGNVKDWISGEITKKNSAQNVRTEDLEHSYELIAPEKMITVFKIQWIYSAAHGTIRFGWDDSDELKEIKYLIYTNLDAEVISVSQRCP